MGVGILVALAACAAPNHGIVHDKRYEPGHTYTTNNCYSYDKNGICKLSVPQSNWEPAHYYLDLYASKDDHGWHEVTEPEYQRYTEGDEYP